MWILGLKGLNSYLFKRSECDRQRKACTGTQNNWLGIKCRKKPTWWRPKQRQKRGLESVFLNKDLNRFSRVLLILQLLTARSIWVLQNSLSGTLLNILWMCCYIFVQLIVFHKSFDKTLQFFESKYLLVLQFLCFNLHIFEYNLLSVFSTRFPSLPCNTVSNLYPKMIDTALCLDWHG